VKICEEEEHHGILFIPKRRKPSEIAKGVVRILEVLDSEDLENEVTFVSYLISVIIQDLPL